jgi:hypothetical protein
MPNNPLESGHQAQTPKVGELVNADRHLSAEELRAIGFESNYTSEARVNGVGQAFLDLEIEYDEGVNDSYRIKPGVALEECDFVLQVRPGLYVQDPSKGAGKRMREDHLIMKVRIPWKYPGAHAGDGKTSFSADMGLLDDDGKISFGRNSGTALAEVLNDAQKAAIQEFVSARLKEIKESEKER